MAEENIQQPVIPRPSHPSKMTQDEMYEAVRASRKGGRKKHAGGPEGLNITAMMDMMTIILVFLLKSWQTSTVDINMANLVPPISTTQLKPEEVVKITVTQKEIMVEDKLVLALKEGRVDPSQKEGGESGMLITPLKAVLDIHVERLDKIASFGGVPFEGKIAIIADKDMQYRLLSEVMYTAGQARFGAFKFFTIAKEQ